MSVFLRLDDFGRAIQTFTLPALPSGMQLNVQGAMISPSGSVELTAAHFITFG